MFVSHPISCNFKIHFTDILSIEVANPASQNRSAGPLLDQNMKSLNLIEPKVTC